MSNLVLGPLLRSVEGSSASVWVETDGPCEVTVTAGLAKGRGRTTEVAGGHYALVVVDGLPSASTVHYRVSIDGDEVWPRPDGEWPAPVIRTADPHRPLRVVFGSCRVDAPLGGSWDGDPDDDPPGHGVDALEALAEHLRAGPVDEWPDLLALLGDQVYADLVVHDPPDHTHRAHPPPDGGLADLADYQEHHRRAWSRPPIRWLLSTVPSVMVFDDHEVIDDWNTSAAWLADISREPWWADRITGGLVAYWVYQHWGNLTPSQLPDDPLASEVAGSDDATGLLVGRAEGWRLDSASPRGQRWSTTRDLLGRASARIVLADTRNRRRLVEGERSVIDAEEMAWIGERSRVDRDGIDHLLLCSSLPWLLPRAVHDLERWAEAVAGGRLGTAAARPADRLRRALDLEHWPAFGSSFDDLAGLLRSIASGEKGTAPGSVLVLSGDVHFSYLARADLGPRARSAVVQLVSSPFRHGVPRGLRWRLRLAAGRLARLGIGALRVTAARAREPLGWSLTGGPWFGNGLGQVALDGRSVTVTFSRSERGADGRARLTTVHREVLAP